jgi:beta-glucosidase
MSRLSLASSLKNSLPQTFHHGYASAAYQIEGGFDQGGRGLSVWEPALEGMDNGDVACDSYHLWEEDVALLKQYGANSYRFSISWSRIIPLGEPSNVLISKRCVI